MEAMKPNCRWLHVNWISRSPFSLHQDKVRVLKSLYVRAPSPSLQKRRAPLGPEQRAACPWEALYPPGCPLPGSAGSAGAAGRQNKERGVRQVLPAWGSPSLPDMGARAAPNPPWDEGRKPVGLREAGGASSPGA